MPLQVGTVEFEAVKEYSTIEEWTMDEHLHRVAPGTPFAWVPGLPDLFHSCHLWACVPFQKIRPARRSLTAHTRMSARLKYHSMFCTVQITYVGVSVSVTSLLASVIF